MKKIGMRNIKTGIAVFLATFAGYLGIVETPVYTVSVCIFSIKNTIKNSLDDSFSRIIGTLVGGLVGYLCARFLFTNIIFAMNLKFMTLLPSLLLLLFLFAWVLAIIILLLTL